MSLRGSETTEAISQGIENKEIAALPTVAHNDKKALRHSLWREGIKGREVWFRSATPWYSNTPESVDKKKGPII
jgi:hypothetical protein